MRLIAFAAASSLALMATAACAPRIDYAHKTTLDCPDRQGELRRTGVSADRKSCTYRADEGAEVTLQLASVHGDAGSTLSAIESSLTGPAAPGAPAKGEETGPAKPVLAEEPASTAGSGDAAKAAQEAAADAQAGKGDWDSGDRRGARTGSGRDNAHVSLPGLHIDADDNNARVDIAGIHIDANDNDATVHVIHDVRLRGEAFSRERNGLRAVFIAKRDNLPDGYRFVGYQAAGPKTGPLTVAIVKSRDELSDGNRLYHDIQRLVRRNAGV